MADTTASTQELAGSDERLAFRGPIQQLLTRPEIGALIGFMAVWLLFWLVAAPFGTVGGTANYLDVASFLGLMAVPVALLMIGGEFDLSAGSMTGATAIIVILLSSDTDILGGAGLSLHLAVPLALAFALAIGWFNGTLVEKTSLPSFIVTLGTFFIIMGGKLGFTKLFTNKVIAESLDESSGYAFWNDIFGASWVRNNHIWNIRDWAWSGLLIIGGVVLLIGILELTYARRAEANPLGYMVAAFGAAVGAFGYTYFLLNKDSVISDRTGAVLIGAGVLLGVGGWCAARYEPADHTATEHTRNPKLVFYIGGGVLAVALAIIIAALMNADDSERLDFLTGDPGRAVLAIGIGATGVLAVLAALGKIRATYPAIGAAVAFIPGISYMITVQGARAILFGLLAIVGVVLLTVAANQLRLAVVVSMSTALAIVALAFFIHIEADSHKLRIELFTTLLLVALVIAASAIARAISAKRTSAPPVSETSSEWTQVGTIFGLIIGIVFAIVELIRGDGILYSICTGIAKGAIATFAVYAIVTLGRTLFTKDQSAGRSLIIVGLGSAFLGLLAKMLFVTQVEADTLRGDTRFGVGVLLFLLFAAAGTWVLTRTQFGNWIFAVGGNKEASRSVGVPAARTKTILFMVVATAAWITGMVTAFRLNSVQANVGDGREFQYIIVAVVGGNLLTGGYGSAFGAAIGAIIWGMITSGIGFATWNSDWRFLVLGGLLLVAVLVNNYVRTKAEKVR